MVLDNIHESVKKFCIGCSHDAWFKLEILVNQEFEYNFRIIKSAKIGQCLGQTIVKCCKRVDSIERQ